MASSVFWRSSTGTLTNGRWAGLFVTFRSYSFPFVPIRSYSFLAVSGGRYYSFLGRKVGA
jgi:hypothetical protein